MAKSCRNCGNEITTGNSKRVYCSDACRVSFFRKGQQITVSVAPIVYDMNPTNIPTHDEPVQYIQLVEVPETLEDIKKRCPFPSGIDRTMWIRKEAENWGL